MKCDREILRKFLSDLNVNEKNVKEIMADLEPLYVRAESGQFTCGAEPNQAEAKQALKLATVWKVKKVVFVSLSQPLPQPKWMAEHVYRNYLLANFMTELWASRRASLGDCLWANARQNRLDEGGDLRAILRISILDNLKYSLEPRLKNGLWDSLEVSIFYRCAYALAGKDDEAAKLSPLLRLMATNPIIGEKYAEPGVWIGLKA